MNFYGIDSNKIDHSIKSYIIENELKALEEFSTRVRNAREEIKNVIIRDGGNVRYLF
jgi:hypothetical protein